MITQQEHMGVETVYKETACKMGGGGGTWQCNDVYFINRIKASLCVGRR